MQSHSIHGMMEGDRGARPHRSMGVLTFDEKKFLLAVERGDVASVRRSVRVQSLSSQKKRFLVSGRSGVRFAP